MNLKNLAISFGLAFLSTQSLLAAQSDCLQTIEKGTSTGLPSSVQAKMKADKLSASAAIAKLRASHAEEGRGDYTLSQADLATSVLYFNPLKKQCVDVPLSRTAYGKDMARHFAYMKQHGTQLVVVPVASRGSWLLSMNAQTRIQTWNGFTLALRARVFDQGTVGGYNDLTRELIEVVGIAGLGEKPMGEILSVTSSNAGKAKRAREIQKLLKEMYDF